MRKITTHVVDGDKAPQLTIEVLDEPGHGGACHLYEIRGSGFSAVIHFQNGPIGEHGVNGVTETALLAVLIDRLEGFQAGPYANTYNGSAALKADAMMELLKQRTRDRIARGVEGTSTV